MRSERLTFNFLTKASPLGYVTYWFSFPSRHTFSIETGIYWLLALELQFCAWPMGAWFPLVPGSLNDGVSFLLGTLFLTTRSSSEDWVPWTDGDSDLLNLPTTRFLALLKTCQLLIGNQPSVIQLWSFSTNKNDQSWMTDDWFPKISQHVFSKARKRIVGRVKISELPSVQGPQFS